MRDLNEYSNCLVFGASGGIGHNVTQQLLAAGNFVIGTYHRDRSGHLDALKTLQDEHNERLHLLSVDITRESQLAAAFERIRKLRPTLNLVMNCTGLLHDDTVLQPEKRLEDVSADNLARAFAVNSSAPLLIARYALPLLRHDGPGVIANLSARVGSIGDNRIGGWYAYRAAKAAQNMITRTLSIELQRRNMTTICVGLHPGTVDTALSRPFQKHLQAGQLHTPEQAAADLLHVIRGLDAGDSGKVFAWDGSEIPP